MTEPKPPDVVHHLAHRSDWEAALRGGRPYVPPGFDRDGFVHCSTPAQVAPTVERWFPPDADLLLLTLDPAALGDSLRFEPGSLGERGSDGEPVLFPHLYAPIDPADPTVVLSAEPYRLA